MKKILTLIDKKIDQLKQNSKKSDVRLHIRIKKF